LYILLYKNILLALLITGINPEYNGFGKQQEQNGTGNQSTYTG
jgi:hypothetical protein